MRYTKQLHWDGCGIACLAIVLGIPYADALRLAFRRSHVQDRRVDFDRIVRVLRSRGVRVRKVRSDFRFFKKGGTFDAAIVGMCWPGQRPGHDEGHFVVWCPEHREFLEPADTRPAAMRDYMDGWQNGGCEAILIRSPAKRAKRS